MCCYHAFCLVVLASHAFYFLSFLEDLLIFDLFCSCTRFSVCSFFNKHFPLKWIFMCTISVSLLLLIHWLNFKIRILSVLVASYLWWKGFMKHFYDAGSIIVESKRQTCLLLWLCCSSSVWFVLLHQNLSSLSLCSIVYCLTIIPLMWLQYYTRKHYTECVSGLMPSQWFDFGNELAYIYYTNM